MSETHTPARLWCEALQKTLMDAIDAAWALAEFSDDPAVIARARDKARLAGQIAAEARKVAALVPPPREAKARPPAPPASCEVAAEASAEPASPVMAPVAAPRSPEPSVRAPAAQAVAMQAALAKLKRR